MIDDLEARGLVERRRLPADRRHQLLHLLPEASDVLREASRIAEDTVAGRLGGLDARQTRRLVLLLQRFVTAS
jgi:DNA-binding MarR family transcriptional regulator